MSNKIKLAHGSGGELTDGLIKEIFIKEFSNPVLNKMNDSAVIELEGKKLAFTTDSFVVNPIFFPGGDIGKLSVCGTINDLCMSGARPVALSCGFIIEEGFEIESLKTIVKSMRETCSEVGVDFVTGDTKVVNKGSVDKIFINTSGIGIIEGELDINAQNAQVGDVIIINGNIGEHGTSVLLARNEFEIESDLLSDVSPLNTLAADILSVTKDIHVFRDPTRGGLATTLNEIAEQSNVEIEIFEENIPVSNSARCVCNILGLDPLYVANEGKLICIVSQNDSNKVLEKMKKNKYGTNSMIIGRIPQKMNGGRVCILTKEGGARIINKLIGDLLPRIC